MWVESEAPAMTTWFRAGHDADLSPISNQIWSRTSTNARLQCKIADLQQRKAQPSQYVRRAMAPAMPTFIDDDSERRPQALTRHAYSSGAAAATMVGDRFSTDGDGVISCSAAPAGSSPGSREGSFKKGEQEDSFQQDQIGMCASVLERAMRSQ